MKSPWIKAGGRAIDTTDRPTTLESFKVVGLCDQAHRPQYLCNDILAGSDFQEDACY